MVKPSELLQDFGMIRITFEHAEICPLGRFVLLSVSVHCDNTVESADNTYIFLLFVDMTNLKPDICLTQWLRRVLDNVLEALCSGSV